jgi:hypothetical protein
MDHFSLRRTRPAKVLGKFRVSFRLRFELKLLVELLKKKYNQLETIELRTKVFIMVPILYF